MNDDFEKRLENIAPREIPVAWRQEILAAAELKKTNANSGQQHWLGWLVNAWQSGLRTPRVAWACLGAAWLLIGTLNVASRTQTAELTSLTRLPAPAIMQALQKERRLLLAELNDKSLLPVADKPHRSVPGPRSARRNEEFFA